MSKPLAGTIDFDGMAASLMFTGKLESIRYGVRYRTGRGANDVNLALRKATKFGNGKVENELGLLALYLSQILKRA